MCVASTVSVWCCLDLHRTWSIQWPVWGLGSCLSVSSVWKVLGLLLASRSRHSCLVGAALDKLLSGAIFLEPLKDCLSAFLGFPFSTDQEVGAHRAACLRDCPACGFSLRGAGLDSLLWGVTALWICYFLLFLVSTQMFCLGFIVRGWCAPVPF